MSWQLFVAFRYLTAKRREKFISIISLISIVGVAVGVASLIIVIAVMSGFDNDLKEKIIGTNSHIVIESDYGIEPSQELITKVLNTRHVISASYFLNGQVLVRSQENVTGVILRGIEPKDEVRVNKLGQYLAGGELYFGADGIVIGSELANRLRLKLGERLTVISPAFVEGRAFKVSGIFTSGMYEYDMNLVYVDIRKAQELLATKGLVSGIAIKVDDAFNVTDTKRALHKAFSFPYVIRTWMDLNKNLLAALKLEKTVMFIILILIVMVACFNIASSLIMTVLEKTKDIGILKAIGSANLNIMTIFAMQGGMIGLLGTLFGTVFGLGLCWCLKTYRFITLPKDIYYIDRLPVNVEIRDIAIIVLSSLALSLLATLYPSYKASRLDPVEALRYE